MVVRFAIFPLLAANALMVVGSGLQAVLLPVRAHLDGFSDQMVGLLGAGYYLGFVVGCLATPHLVRRIGHIRAFAVLAVLGAQTFPLHAASGHVLLWLALRFVAGCCLAGLSMIVESWLNEVTHAAARGRVLAVYLMVGAIASLAGQSLLGVADPRGFAPFLVVCLCLSLSLVPLAISLAPAPSCLDAVTIDLRRLYRTSPLGFVGCLFIGLANGSFWSLAPAILQSQGATTADVAVFMGSAILGGACAQWPIGRLSDRHDRRVVMLASCVTAGLAALALATMHGLGPLWRAGLAAALGCAAFPLYALCSAHANDHAGPGAFVETNSGLLLSFGLGAVAGPVIAGAILGAAGAGLFVFMAAAYLGLAAFVGWRMVARAPVGLEARHPFRGQFPECPARLLTDPLGPTESPEPFPEAVQSALGHLPPRWGAR